ncbi:hypothetical protein EDB83DRAFT_2518604 [Lactarius deliciosus]|nr:hypothetical protein EDB83DRAFT_2518604 [Lactarius deliciosus]
MAEVVWETLTCYGIQDWIFAFMLDNTSNNDTMLESVQQCAREEGIRIKASWVHLRCIPHTIHLAAVKLLEAISAITKEDTKKAVSCGGNYQDSATSPLDRMHDDDVVGLEDGEGGDEMSLQPDASERILQAIDKLRKIVCTIRSSPQRKQAWLKQVESSLQGNNDPKSQRALMLILDV